MHFRGLPHPQFSRLTERIGLLEHSDPGARRAEMSTNGYAVFSGQRFILFDVNSMVLKPLLAPLLSDGFRPAALVFSHRHPASLGDAVQRLMDDFSIPAFLHPKDAGHFQARQTGINFEDPMENPLFAEFGIEPILFPGHTAGHIALYSSDDGGLLLAGDAAMGPPAPATRRGVEFLVRPPLSTNVDDEMLRQHWVKFDRPLKTVLPYHGTGYIDRADDLAQIMAPLVRPEATDGLDGEPLAASRSNLFRAQAPANPTGRSG
jgi:glyoxylase-like metal-dependent hydrolase (beta-lactamase superfamily II)